MEAKKLQMGLLRMEFPTKDRSDMEVPFQGVCILQKLSNERMLLLPFLSLPIVSFCTFLGVSFSLDVVLVV